MYVVQAEDVELLQCALDHIICLCAQILAHHFAEASSLLYLI